VGEMVNHSVPLIVQSVFDFTSKVLVSPEAAKSNELTVAFNSKSFPPFLQEFTNVAAHNVNAAAAKLMFMFNLRVMILYF
jgi:hypothetical protein